MKLGYNELGYNKLGYNELSYNEVGYNQLGYNEHSIITIIILRPESTYHLSHKTPRLLTNHGYNEQIWSVQSCLLSPP